MTKKLSLQIEDLEDRIAPALVLPNDMVIFADFDNPAPGEFHPAFAHSPAEGPWQAHFNSPVIGI